MDDLISRQDFDKFLEDAEKEKAKKMIRFPIDCPLDCPHMKAWDMSIDDWTYKCDELKTQIDGCDTFFKSLLPNCPIEA